jgi:hypothetical protein
VRWTAPRPLVLPSRSASLLDAFDRRGLRRRTYDGLSETLSVITVIEIQLLLSGPAHGSDAHLR